MPFNYNQGINPEENTPISTNDVEIITISNSNHYIYLRNILVGVWNEKRNLLSLNKRAKQRLGLNVNEDFDYEVVKDNIPKFILNLFLKGD